MTAIPTTPAICVIGLGYVGLPTAALIAAHGLTVTGVDIDDTVVASVNSASTRSTEPGLDALVRAAVTSGHLIATSAPRVSDVFIIAVPTPIAADRRAGLAAVEAATLSLAPVLATGNLVILESTCPIGTTAHLSRLLAKCCPGLTFPHTAPDRASVQIAYSPERVLPGHALHELAANARIIGGLDHQSAERAATLYALFCRGGITLTNAATAEAAKLAENAYRDVNIAFANELSMICDDLGLDAQTVIALANRHPRVAIAAPGPGVGGHCIPVDPWFLVEAAPQRAHLIRAARAVNDAKPAFVANQIRTATAYLDHPVIALLGLAYKPDIDDLRGSPAVTIALSLAANPAATILVVEPHIDALPPELAALGNVHLTTAADALATAHLPVLLVPHAVFKSLRIKTPAQLAQSNT